MSDQEMKAIAEKVAQRVQKEEAMISPGDEQVSKDSTLAFVWQCFFSNEVGDSLLYNHIHQGKFAHNVVSSRWMAWVNPHWVIDHKGAALAAAEGVVDQYLRLVDDLDKKIRTADSKGEASKLGKRKTAILKRIDRLRTARGRKSLISCCATNSSPIFIHPDMLDQDPWLMGCSNGVIDLRTGAFRAGSPYDYLTIASNIKWLSIDEPCPHWMSFLDTILDGDTEVIGYLQRVLGYACTGLNQERVFFVFFGRHGQNGKGTLMEILYHVLGKLAGPIQSEMLMSQKFSRSTSGPSPDLMALKGRRLAWASETEEGQSFAAGRLKLFSGGDPLVGRGLNDKEQTTFMPSHTLFLLTNSLPHAPAHDNAFWERIRVINFPFSFVTRAPAAKHERPADPKLLDKLKQESSGILAWLVRGCLDWQLNGMSTPEKVISESLKYRRSEDDLQDFVEQCCQLGDPEDSGLREKAKTLYGRYKTWWADQSPSRPMSAKKFGDCMSRKGFGRMKSHGQSVYKGIRIVIDHGDSTSP